MTATIHALRPRTRSAAPASTISLPSDPLPPTPISAALSPSDAWFDESLTVMVRGEAGRIHRRLPPSSSLQLEELYSIGLLALVEAARRFDPGRGVEFAAFASRRVIGAMLDELRQCDTVSRARRNAIRRGLEGPDAPVLPKVVELEAADAIADPDPDPEHRVVQLQSYAKLRQAEKKLPPRLRLLIDLRARSDWTLQQIADHLGVTRARACQLVGEGVQRLREAMNVDAELAEAA